MPNIQSLRLISMVMLLSLTGQSYAQTTLSGSRHVGPGQVAASTSTFRLGASRDNGATFVSTAGPADILLVRGEIDPEAAHVGQPADIFVVIRVLDSNQNHLGFLMLTSSDTSEFWNGSVSLLKPFRRNELLDAVERLDLFTGALGSAFELRFYLGYMPADGILRYHVNGLPLTITAPAPATGQGVTFYPSVPGAVYNGPRFSNSPGYLALGADGNIWFTESGTGTKIGRITPAGVFTEFPLPGSFPSGIAAGADGNLWITELSNKIARITPAGVVTEFTVAAGGRTTQGITAGPDGNVWFIISTDFFAPGKIGRITPAGVITEFAVPVAGPNPNYTSTKPGGQAGCDITAGPDGNLWFVEQSYGQIGRITPTGSVTKFLIPSSVSAVGTTERSNPYCLTPGPDGNMWFTGSSDNGVGTGTVVGSITMSGAITKSVLQINGAQITKGSDGNLWISGTNNGLIYRVTTAGAVTTYDLNPLAPNTVGGGVRSPVTGADGNLWFSWQGSIGKLSVTPK